MQNSFTWLPCSRVAAAATAAPRRRSCVLQKAYIVILIITISIIIIVIIPPQAICPMLRCSTATLPAAAAQVGPAIRYPRRARRIRFAKNFKFAPGLKTSHLVGGADSTPRLSAVNRARARKQPMLPERRLRSRGENFSRHTFRQRRLFVERSTSLSFFHHRWRRMPARAPAKFRQLPFEQLRNRKWPADARVRQAHCIQSLEVVLASASAPAAALRVHR